MDDHQMPGNVPAGIIDEYHNLIVAPEDIKSVVIGDGITYIGDFWFYNCPNLTSVIMPEGIETGMFNFRLSPWLESVEPDENGLRIVGGVLLDGMGCDHDLVVPANVQHIAGGAFVSTGGGVFMGAPAMQKPVKVVIPGTVKTIGNNAFYHAVIAELTIEEGVTSIAASAFEGASMQDEAVTIPASVKSIGEWAFSDTGLSDITILNPDCELGKDFILMGGLPISGAVHGYAGSTAETYAKENGCTFEVLGDQPSGDVVPGDVVPGDVNGDKEINAVDAADLLIAAALIGAGEDPALTDVQKAAADVDNNEEINAVDASIILQYAAAIGAGETAEMRDFI